MPHRYQFASAVNVQQADAARVNQLVIDFESETVRLEFAIVDTSDGNAKRKRFTFSATVAQLNAFLGLDPNLESRLLAALPLIETNVPGGGTVVDAT